MPAGLDIVWNPLGLAELPFHPALLGEILDDVKPVVRGARADAPKKTGAGAASIHSEPVLVNGMPGVAIGWDREHYYMRFHEQGTVRLPARPFLVPALDRYL